MKKTLIIIIAAASCFLMKAQDSKNLIENWFGSDAAEAVFPNLDKNARLDMLDYFNSGHTTPSVESYYGSKVAVTGMTDTSLQLKSDNLTYDIYCVASGKDTCMVVVETLPLGKGDASVKVCDTAGNPVPKAFTMPVYTDWLKKDALKTVPEGMVLSQVPYVTVHVGCDTAGGLLTLTNTSVTIPGIDASVAAAFKPRLVYVYKNGVFKLKK